MRHNSTIKTRRTDVIKRDVAPKFNESFSFKMTADVLDVCSVGISVWQSVSALKGPALRFTSSLLANFCPAYFVIIIVSRVALLASYRRRLSSSSGSWSAISLEDLSSAEPTAHAAMRLTRRGTWKCS